MKMILNRRRDIYINIIVIFIYRILVLVRIVSTTNGDNKISNQHFRK